MTAPEEKPGWPKGAGMLTELSDKNADIERLAGRACSDSSVLSEIVGGLRLKVNTKSPEETVRYNCFKVLMQITRTRSELLYPQWNGLVGFLSSDNSYHKMAAVQLVAGLVKADVENRFESIFDKYFALLDDQSMIVAIYVASNAGKIVSARPGLEPRVTRKLLEIERTHHIPGRKALVVAGAIEAFDAYMSLASDRERILEFVDRQQQSDSPKTRKLARQFLKKWGNR
jgi:hypothetical protein